MHVDPFLVCVAVTFLFYLCIVIIYAIICGIVKQLRKKREQKRRNSKLKGGASNVH